jgi:hypothetical protein
VENKPLTVGDLLNLLFPYSPDTPVFVNGWGSAEGSYLKAHAVTLKETMSPSQMMNKLYNVAPEDANEFSDEGKEDWNKKHGFKAIVIE